MRTTLLTMIAAVSLALPATAQTLDRIKETGQLNLGYRLDAKPMSYALETGEPAGYTPLVCVRVAQAITNHLKLDDLQVQFVPVDSTDRFEKVVNGEVDLHCGAATITMERRAMVDFSVPVFIDGTSLILRKDAGEQFSDLAGKKLGVRRATTTENALVNSLTGAAVVAEVVRFADHEAGMAAMESGEIDAYFADQSILVGLYASSPERDQFKMSTDILTVEKQGIVMARGDSELRDVVDKAVSQMYANGQMQSILKEAIPSLTPGIALQALYMVAPILD
ncbi:amino acid ABC transporter substrate-binding protein [Shimia abyssi]|uniref:Amino acid ABC transporter substrate-binding protein (PAAT family) n=1 Tax=Shimia abyssi TaxID=1662395 RepID=A0A2P8F8F9_9RHOB|nr:amino acid ABC transporter substrate-binding protein [Shimia abyssi]PSL18011.1 amino acid ABC transporter substrate-binding protein (PAAT family) [Shimia abyssi]